MTLAERLLAGEHHGCPSWAAVARRLGTTERHLRDVRSTLAGKGTPVEIVTQGDKTAGSYRDVDKGIGKPIDEDLHTYIAGTVAKKWPSVERFDATPEPVIEVIPETITRVEEHRLKKRVRDLEAENRQLAQQLSEGGEYAEVVAEALARQHEGPRVRIAPRERASGLREGTPLVLASDWHIEEEVRPEQVAGRNRYNLEIAAQRMTRYGEASLECIQHQREVYKIRDMLAWFGGDFITNFLHDDNVESNLLHPTEAILFAEEGLSGVIDHWLTDPEIEQCTIFCNDGNHGRLTDKTRAATRIQNSLEVFLYAHLAQRYRNEPRIRFVLPTSQFTYLDDIYGRTIRGTHGDVFNYSGGVGGITVPMFRALSRWETVKRADLTVMGHWHQRICLPNVLVNGSLIGYNPYAFAGGFPFEQPVQSMRMLDSHRWCGPDIPLFVSDRADDEQARAA